MHMLRRLKTIELASQLPRKTEVCVYVPLTDLQERMYMRFLDSIDVQTCLGKSKVGDETGPLWRLNHNGEEEFSRRPSPIALIGCVQCHCLHVLISKIISSPYFAKL